MNTLGALAVLAGGLSLAVLLKRGFSLEWSQFLSLLIDGYDYYLDKLFRWAEPLLLKLLNALPDWMIVDVELYPQWKHIFFLMWLYFGRDAQIDFVRSRFFSSGFTFVWGGVVALAASVGASLSPLHGAASNNLTLVLPVLGFIIFELVRGMWRALIWGDVRRADGVPDQTWSESVRYYWLVVMLPIALGGGALIVLKLAMERFQILPWLPNPSLFLLLSFLVIIALLLIGRGMALAFTNRFEDEGWLQRFFRSGSARLGVLLLRVFGVTVALVVLNSVLLILGF